MLKIDDSIKRKNVPRHVTTHLGTVNVDEVKKIVIFLTLFLDLLTIIPIIGDPFLQSYFYPIIIPMILLNSWAVLILVRNPYGTQIETLYFIATVGMIGALCIFVVSQKIAYAMAGIESYGFLIVSILFYLSWMVYFAQYIVRKYADMKWNIHRKNRLLDILGIIIIFIPGNGYTTYQIHIKNTPFADHISAIIWLLIGIFYIYIGVLFCHRILYNQFNQDRYRLQKPSKKERKQAEAKGRVIVVR